MQTNIAGGNQQALNQRRSLRLYFVFFFLTLLLFLILAFLYGRIVIQNDGITYYALAASLVQDGDFDLQNQSQDFPELRFSPAHDRKSARSLYSCGFAFLYAPFIHASEALSQYFKVLANWRPYSQNARFPFPDALGIFAGSFVYGLLSVFLAWSLLIQRYHASGWTAFWISIAVFIGTSLMFYTLTVPSFVQAVDTFLVTAILYLALLPRSIEFLNIRFRNVLLGFFLALSVMLRNNNIVLIPSTLAIFLWPLRSKGLKTLVIAGVEIFAGALPVAVVQANFNLTQYGSSIATGYPLPVAAYWKAHVSQLFRFYQMLVDPSTGLFIWSPIAALGLIGLLAGVRQRRQEPLLALVTVAIVVLSISLYGWIYGGTSFGQRFLAHLYICWVIGVYETFLRWKTAARVASVLFVCWTFLLLNAYFINSTSAEGRKLLQQTYRSHENSPFDTLQFSWKEYHAARKDGKVSNPIRFWFQSLGAHPYPTVQYILRNR